MLLFLWFEVSCWSSSKKWRGNKRRTRVTKNKVMAMETAKVMTKYLIVDKRIEMETNINISVTATATTTTTTTEAEDTIITMETNSVPEEMTTIAKAVVDNKITTIIITIIVPQMIRICLAVCEAIIIFGVIAQITAQKLHKLLRIIITVVTITHKAITIWEIIPTIKRKAALRKVIITINLTMNTIFSNILQMMPFLTTTIIITIIANNSYHCYWTIQDTRTFIIITVFLLTTWDDCWRII